MMDRIDQLEWDMKMLRDKTPFAAIQYIRKSIGYDGFLRECAAGHKGREEEFMDILEEIQQNSKAYRTTAEWFDHVADYKAVLEKPDTKGVSLMTMHSAKGLEYELVFIIEGNEGCIPYKKAKLLKAVEEERRLFYVAMTRAKQKLIISYVKEKNGKDMDPSRFVEELLLV